MTTHTTGDERWLVDAEVHLQRTIGLDSVTRLMQGLDLIVELASQKIGHEASVARVLELGRLDVQIQPGGEMVLQWWRRYP